MGNKKYLEQPRLVIKQRKDNTVEMKFGPDEYSRDMNLFMNLLFTGLMQGLNVISRLGNTEEEKDNLYGYVNNVLTTSLHQAFPDVVDKIKKQEEFEIELVAAVDAGEGISDETKEKIALAKKEVAKRFKPIESNSTLQKQIEDTYESFVKEIEKLNSLDNFFEGKFYDYDDDMEVYELTRKLIKEKLEVKTEMFSEFKKQYELE